MTILIRKICLTIAFLLIPSMGYTYEDGYNSEACCAVSDNCSSCEAENCGTAFIGAEVLYWRGFESGLSTCELLVDTDIVTSDGRVSSTIVGRGQDLKFRWNPGFRIGAGYDLGNCNWDFAAIWTHFNSHANGSKNNGNRIRWNINLDVVDVLAGYEAELCCSLILRPFVGVRGARLEQKLHTNRFHASSSSSSIDDVSSFSSDSFSSTSDFSSANNLFTIRLHNKERFLGVGPLIGLEADWNVGRGFSFYTSASASWLYGRFHVNLNEFQESSSFISSLKSKWHIKGTLTVGDAELGIRWQTCLCNLQLIFQLGLEHHSYFDFNRFGSYGDLSFDGVNFGAGIEF